MRHDTTLAPPHGDLRAPFSATPRRIAPGPGQESVWDYPRPPRLEPVAQPVTVEHRGKVIAATHDALRVVETASPPTYYIPRMHVRMEWLNASGRISFCEWKGHAVYWSLDMDGAVVEDVAWSYPMPTPSFAELRDCLAFYAGRVDHCRVGTHVVTPQPGGFYGGWVTPDIVGPFKGEPGTESW